MGVKRFGLAQTLNEFMKWRRIPVSLTISCRSPSSLLKCRPAFHQTILSFLWRRHLLCTLLTHFFFSVPLLWPPAIPRPLTHRTPRQTSQTCAKNIPNTWLLIIGNMREAFKQIEKSKCGLMMQVKMLGHNRFYDIVCEKQWLQDVDMWNYLFWEHSDKS